ncbi:MgtC/SapB family protein [Brevundimonas subvibrioides]|uniref:Protein MgtC n=1 Tax=Brevundimonas subvibrioides (strain ATCC 15264 / DSM 4735 / LMG 14903 / NBRC 16000 / CB 81) TaxID=633149 RepID=D9QFH9_BRESC|nr:MgtC/SapB family protein [Brevundimonas subvibrioides]ADL02494.1 MgtC/SapB transporter [Brevundimonas subvibrioides ATCC 15264]
MVEDLTGYWAPVLGSILAGGVIGLEREWRGRAAGLRTHILVCLASALLMQAAMTQNHWAFLALPEENIVTDPTRMAHGVLTGIGFLCAGVIFRTGFSIHGLTTAASLWITSAIGILFGVGLYGLGILATGVTAVILVALRLISLRLPARTVVDVEVGWARGDTATEDAVEAALATIDPAAHADRIEVVENGTLAVRSWRVQLRGATDLKSLATTLSDLPGLSRLQLNPRDD